MAIASYFQISLDCLFGVERENKKEAICETYSDIFKMLFSLGDSLDITIKDMYKSDIYGYGSDESGESYDSRFDTFEQCAVSFGDAVIIDVLGEWQTALKARNLTDGERLYETWKQGIFSKYNFEIGSQSPVSSDARTDPTSSTQGNESLADIPDEEMPFS